MWASTNGAGNRELLLGGALYTLQTAVASSMQLAVQVVCLQEKSQELLQQQWWQWQLQVSWVSCCCAGRMFTRPPA